MNIWKYNDDTSWGAPQFLIHFSSPIFRCIQCCEHGPPFPNWCAATPNSSRQWRAGATQTWSTRALEQIIARRHATISGFLCVPWDHLKIPQVEKIRNDSIWYFSVYTCLYFSALFGTLWYFSVLFGTLWYFLVLRYRSQIVYQSVMPGPAWLHTPISQTNKPLRSGEFGWSQWTWWHINPYSPVDLCLHQSHICLTIAVQKCTK